MSEPDLLTLLATETLGDFQCDDVTLLGATKPVYVTGQGPAVIVMSEMPGIYHHVARFARFVRDAGFAVWMPHLFGTIGAMPTPDQFRFTMARACISRGFRAFAADSSSPIMQWLRALAKHAHAACGGKRGRRDRDVFYRQLRVVDDARTCGARAGAVAAVAAARARRRDASRLTS